jgi:hypothetical protein
LKIIIGKAKVIAERLNTKLSLIAKTFGRKLKILLKKSFVYKIQSTAKKLN